MALHANTGGKSLFGQWIEEFPNGNRIITRFDEARLVAYSVDPLGNKVEDMGDFTVTYSDLAPDTLAVQFEGGGSVVVRFTSAQTIVMEFPGMGIRNLRRVEEN